MICLDLVIKGRYHRQATEFNQNWKKWRFVKLLLELTTKKKILLLLLQLLIMVMVMMIRWLVMIMMTRWQ